MKVGNTPKAYVQQSGFLALYSMWQTTNFTKNTVVSPESLRVWAEL